MQELEQGHTERCNKEKNDMNVQKDNECESKIDDLTKTLRKQKEDALSQKN